MLHALIIALSLGLVAEVRNQHPVTVEFVQTADDWAGGMYVESCPCGDCSLSGHWVYAGHSVWAVLPYPLPKPTDPAYAITHSWLSNNRIPGDLNGDGLVNVGDLQILVSLWSLPASASPVCDIDGDGTIGQGDLQVIVDHWNQSIFELWRARQVGPVEVVQG